MIVLRATNETIQELRELEAAEKNLAETLRAIIERRKTLSKQISVLTVVSGKGDGDQS